MSQPRITVITPSLNQAAFLERAICSVLDQGYDNLQYIVVDAGSTDGSEQIVRNYQPKLDYISCPAGNSPAQAINHALTFATGDYVGILNTDNIYLPGTLDEIARAASDQPHWIVGSALSIGEHDESLGWLNTHAPESLLSLLMHNAGPLPGAATFYCKKTLDAVGPFLTSMHAAYDYEMACRLVAHRHMPMVIPHTIAAIREHAGSRSADHAIQLGLETIRAAQRHADRLPLHERPLLWHNCDQRRRIYTLAQAEARGSEAKRFLWQRLLHRPWWLASEHYRRQLLTGAADPVKTPEQAPGQTPGQTHKHTARHAA